MYLESDFAKVNTKTLLEYKSDVHVVVVDDQYNGRSCASFTFPIYKNII